MSLVARWRCATGPETGTYRHVSWVRRNRYPVFIEVCMAIAQRHFASP
ncbi:hypothetical protein KCP74_07435 [Salmonella enterica subsp. enterica]|nr:hypothetical protein KCP74_07435 [Salmonella enterica subsp. enterica]